ncbi:MAG: hypothetical protein QNJ02_13990, partial [Desulfobacterales bacterium]|nr:hypothetical protein [Desulfobacterales bacterium]
MSELAALKQADKLLPISSPMLGAGQRVFPLPRRRLMKTFLLKRRQILPTDLESAWQFFSNPANLRLITPPWLDFRITSRVP